MPILLILPYSIFWSKITNMLYKATQTLEHQQQKLQGGFNISNHIFLPIKKQIV